MFELESETAVPPEGAKPVSVTVPFEVPGAVTAVGLSETALKAAGVTVSEVVFWTPASVAVIVTEGDVLTPRVET